MEGLIKSSSVWRMWPAVIIWIIRNRVILQKKWGFRPMVSRMLSEARALGVVEITVHEPDSQVAGLFSRFCRMCMLLRAAGR